MMDDVWATNYVGGMVCFRANILLNILFDRLTGFPTQQRKQFFGAPLGWRLAPTPPGLSFLLVLSSRHRTHSFNLLLLHQVFTFSQGICLDPRRKALSCLI